MVKKSQSFVAAVPTYLKDLRAAKRAYSKRLLMSPAKPAKGKAAAAPAPVSRPNVVGVGIGEKIVEGKPTGITCVKFLVRTKYPESRLARKDRLPKTINGLPVDIEEVGTFRRLAAVATKKSSKAGPLVAAPSLAAIPNPRTRFRPIQPGASVGFRHPNPLRQVAGTFGALVRDASGTYILSNNHILANENLLPLGSAIFQPGLRDGGNPNLDSVATLTRFEQLRPDSSNNKVDCAIARISNNTNSTNSILHIGPPRSQGRAQNSMEVHKFGRSSEYSVGRVTSAEMDVTVLYETGAFNFQGQIIIKGQDGQLFASEGDSGALVLERGTQKVVGMLLGVGINSSGEAHAIACHIDDVLQALGVSLVV